MNSNNNFLINIEFNRPLEFNCTAEVFPIFTLTQF